MVNFNSTIFRTITDEATGANKSIGLFGKSLTELKGILSSVKTNGLFKTSIISDTDIQCIKDYNTLIEGGTPHLEAMEQATKGASSATAQMIKNANGNTIALNQMTLGAKATSVAMKALSIAGNMLLMWAISEGISLVVKGLDKLIITASEAKEASDNFMSSLKSMRDDFSKNSKTISSLNDRYKELAQGVDKMGNNISLTSSEYEEYKDIISQVSDMLPDMNTYYDSQGNKIGFVTGKLKDLNDEYDKYQKRTAQDFLVNGNENGKTVDDMIKQFNRTNGTSEDNVQGNNSGYWGGVAAYWGNLFGQNNADDRYSTQAQIDVLQAIYDVGEEAFVDRYTDWARQIENFANPFGEQYTFDTDILTMLGENGFFKETDPEKLVEIYEDIPNKIAELSSKIDAELENLRYVLSQYLYNNDDYYNLTDEQQTIVSGFISNLDEGTMRALGILDEDDHVVKEKLNSFTDDIVSIFKNNPDISQALSDIMNFDVSSFDGSINEADKYIQDLLEKISKKFNIDKDSLSKMFGFDTILSDFEANKKKLEKSLNIEYVDKYGVPVSNQRAVNSFLNSLSVGDLTIAAELDITTNPTDIQSELDRLAEGGNVNLKVRPKVSAEDMKKAGWEEFDGDYATLYSSTFGNYDNSIYMNFTPILPNGKVLTPEQFETYCNQVVNGEREDDLKLKIGADFSSLEEAENAAIEAHQWSALQIAVDKKDSQGVLDVLQEMIDKKKELENPVNFSDIFDMGTDDVPSRLKQLSTELDNIQKAYSTLKDALDTYSKSGVITIDQFQSILDLGGQFFDYLLDEEGNLRTDTEAMRELAAARLLNMKYQAQQAAIDNLNNIKNDSDANLLLASTNYELADSYNYLIQKQLEAAKLALQIKVANGELSQGLANKAINKTVEDIKKLDDITNVVSLGDTSMKGDSDSSKSKSSSNSEKELDFFEYRIKEYEEAIDSLETHLDNLRGSKAKNIVIDDIIKVQSLKQSDLQKAIDMYRSQADELFNKIPQEYREASKNGALAVVDFVEASSDENDTIAETIEKYRDLTEKVADYETEIEELNKTLRELQKQKFDNIVDDFEKLLDVISASTDKLNDLIDLQEKQYGTSSAKFYEELIAQEKERLRLLNEEKSTLQSQMDLAIRSGAIKYGSDEWNEMTKSIQDVNSSIIESTGSLEEFQDAINELHWENFNEFIEQTQGVGDELNNLADLLSREDLFKTQKAGNASELAGIFNISKDSDELDFGATEWTDEGITAIGAYAQAMQTAQYNAEQFSEQLSQLDKDYANGKYSLEEYNEKRDELLDGQWQEIDNYNTAKDAMKDLYDNYIDAQIDAIDKEVEAYSKLIEKQKDYYQRLLDENDAQKELLESKKSLTDINAQILAMSGDTSDAGIAKRLKLEQQLSDTKQDYDNKVYKQNITNLQNSLDDEYERFSQNKEKQKTELEESKNDSEKIIKELTDFAIQNADIVLKTITTTSQNYGIKISDAVTKPWTNGKTALARYDSTMASKSSSLRNQLETIKIKTYEVQTQADITASSLINTFGVSSAHLQGELTSVSNGLQTDIDKANGLYSQFGDLFSANGLDTSGLVGKINGIAGAVDGVSNSVITLKDYLDGLDGTDVDINLNYNTNTPTLDTSEVFYDGSEMQKTFKNLGLQKSNTNESKKDYYLLSPNGSIIDLGNITQAQAEAKLAQFNKGKLPAAQYKLQAYATGGTITDKDGLNISPLSNGDNKLVAVKPGEGILTPVQNEAWQNLSKIAPQLNTYFNDIVKIPNLPEIKRPTNTINYTGGDIIVQGNLDNVTMKQVENTVNKQINYALDKFTRAALL